MSQWARSNPEAMDEIAGLPLGEQNAAMRAAMDGPTRPAPSTPGYVVTVTPGGDVLPGDVWEWSQGYNGGEKTVSEVKRYDDSASDHVVFDDGMSAPLAAMTREGGIWTLKSREPETALTDRCPECGNPCRLVFGREVRRYREQRGMTQAELAEKVDRSPSMLAAVEQGRRQVHADEIVPFARALDVLPVALLGPVFGGGYKEGYLDGLSHAHDRLRRWLDGERMAFRDSDADGSTITVKPVEDDGGVS